MRVIETERLLLRMFTTDDLDDLSVIFSNPDVIRHLGSGKPLRREETERALHGIIRHYEQHGLCRWAAIFKSTGKLIGFGGLRSFNGTPELVYLLDKPYWGIGLATELAQISLKYGFEQRSFERIIAFVKPANIASHHVMKKIGMRFEKNATILGMDVVCYSITCEEHFSKQLNGLNIHGDNCCPQQDLNLRPIDLPTALPF